MRRSGWFAAWAMMFACAARAAPLADDQVMPAWNATSFFSRHAGDAAH